MLGCSVWQWWRQTLPPEARLSGVAVSQLDLRVAIIQLVHHVSHCGIVPTTEHYHHHTSSNEWAMKIALLLTTAFMVVELVGGIFMMNLALRSDVSAASACPETNGVKLV
ncbi:hypothetical protein ECAE60S_01206 [Eoetvoesiella caeni]